LKKIDQPEIANLMGHAIKEKLDLGWTYSGKNGKRSVKGKNGYAGGGSKKRLKIIEN